MYMTKIALTDSLKQTALQQYHPKVNIATSLEGVITPLLIVIDACPLLLEF